MARLGKFNKELHLAADRGDIEAVVAMLDEGADINECGWHQWPLLTLAAQKGHVDLVRVLLDRGADIDGRSGGGDGKTALHYAGWVGRVEVVRLLLEAGAEVDAPDEYANFTPFILAAGCEFRDTAKETAELLLAHGADINAGAKCEWTALMYAAGGPEGEDMVNFLLDRGAAIDARDQYGRTVLMQLPRTIIMRPEMSAFLLQRGADLELRDNEGMTALMGAANYAQTAMMEQLLDRGACIDQIDNEGKTALVHASGPPPEASVIGVLNRLEQKRPEGLGERQTQNLQEQWKKRALAVKILLQYGANPQIRDSQGLTAFDWALQQPRISGIIEVLERF
jgi:ankyrin repeat protein